MVFPTPGEPRQTCQICDRYVVAVPSSTGFPPDIAKEKLRNLCLADGHESDPQYTAGFQLAPLQPWSQNTE